MGNIFHTSIIAQAAPQPSLGDALFQMLPFVIMIFGIFYFVYQRPMQKEQDDHKKMVTGLIVGDRVVTIGGVLGEVLSIEDTSIVLKTGQKSSLTILKSSIRSKVKEE
ncbi:MAG: preprotein translocase subunit YajC [Deltaproteobacteria bacterium]|nr:preprotein translocase subunit YajC [Deltaproteobacteria bacterium]